MNKSMMSFIVEPDFPIEDSLFGIKYEEVVAMESVKSIVEWFANQFNIVESDPKDDIFKQISKKRNNRIAGSINKDVLKDSLYTMIFSCLKSPYRKKGDWCLKLGTDYYPDEVITKCLVRAGIDEDDLNFCLPSKLDIEIKPNSVIIYQNKSMIDVVYLPKDSTHE